MFTDFVPEYGFVKLDLKLNKGTETITKKISSKSPKQLIICSEK